MSIAWESIRTGLTIFSNFESGGYLVSVIRPMDVSCSCSLSSRAASFLGLSPKGYSAASSMTLSSPITLRSSDL